jgi:hypothetical protein
MLLLMPQSPPLPTQPPSGYSTPTAADLKARYPAFSAVNADVISYWIADAMRSIDTSWSEGDYAVALLALAAHNMAISGLGTDDDITIPGGVTGFRMGPVQIGLTREAANAKLGADYSSTRYGAEFRRLLRANFGGPVVAPTGAPLGGIWPDLFVL